MKNLLVFFGICISLCLAEDYTQLLENISFDFKDKKYPHYSYITEGASVISKNFIKLIPAVPYRAGEVILRKKIRTLKMQVDIDFTILTAPNIPNSEPYGFAMWYINSKKPIKDSKGSLFGFKGDYSGLGVFIFNDLHGNMVLHGHVNRGMEEYALRPEGISNKNACTILGNIRNVPRAIR